MEVESGDEDSDDGDDFEVCKSDVSFYKEKRNVHEV